MNDWGAICWAEDFYEATNRKEMEIFDRVGGGDVRGLMYGFIATGDPRR